MPTRSRSVVPGQPDNLARGRGRPPRTEVFRRVEAAVREVHDTFGGLPSPEAAAGIWAEIWVHETHNSTAIEGNALVLRQVEQLLRDGIAVGNRQLAEYLEVRGYADAAEWACRQAVVPGDAALGAEAPLVTVREIRHLHHLAMTPVSDVAAHPSAGPDERPGDLRRHDIDPFPGGMTPPTHPLVGARLQDWLDELPGPDYARPPARRRRAARTSCPSVVGHSGGSEARR